MTSVGNSPPPQFFRNADMNSQALEAGGKMFENIIEEKEIRQVNHVTSVVIPQLEELHGDYLHIKGQLEAQIHGCDDFETKMGLQEELAELEAAWRAATDGGPGLHTPLGEFGEIWESRLSNLRSAMVRGDAVATGKAGPLAIGDVIEAGGKSGKTVTSENAGSSGIDGPDKAGESDDSSEVFKGDWPSFDGYSQMLKNDPEAAFAMLEEMGPKEMQAFMMRMQEEMQAMNRMFSLMTNIHKSIHDTAKAAIGNMRV